MRFTVSIATHHINSRTIIYIKLGLGFGLDRLPGDPYSAPLFAASKLYIILDTAP